MAAWRWVSDTHIPDVYLVQRDRQEVAMVSLDARVRYPRVLMDRIVSAMATLEVETYSEPSELRATIDGNSSLERS